MYSKTHDGIWQSLKIKEVSQLGKLVFIYLFSCPHRNIIGMYRLPLEYIATDIGEPLPKVKATVSELLEKGLIAYDFSTEIVLVKGFLEHNPLANSNTIKCAVTKFNELQKSPIFNDFLTVLLRLPNRYETLIQTVRVLVSNKEEEKEEETEAVKEEEDIGAEPEQADSGPQPIITLTLNDKTEYGIFESDIPCWQDLYPAVDIVQEFRKMKGWLNANPTKRKTKAGIKRFINTWLAKEQDKGGIRSGGRAEQDTRENQKGRWNLPE